MFVMDSVLVKPVVNRSLEVNMISEVAGSCRGHKEVVLIRD